MYNSKAHNSDLHLRYEKYKNILKDLTLMSDIFMRNVFKKQECTELGRLMHDMHCKNADEMYSKILAQRVYELKETQEGVNNMCQEMDQIYKEGIGTGELKKARETAISLAELGISVDIIAQAIKVNINIVQEWISENIHQSTSRTP